MMAEPEAALAEVVQVQDEEDIELMQMISTQMQLLEKDFMTEMQRYLSQVKPEGE